MAILALLLAAILWGTIGPVAKFAFENGMHPIEVAFWRGLIGGGCFFIEAVFKKSLFVEKKDIFPIILFSIVGVLGLECTNLLSVQLGGAGFASILLYSAPIWVFIFSAIFLKEQINIKKIVALFITITGVIGVSYSHLNIDQKQVGFWAVFWGIISGFSYASFYLFGKLYFNKYKAFTLYAYSFPLASLLISPFVPFLGFQKELIWVLLYMGIPSTYLAYWFYSWGLKRIEATKASIITTLEPVVAVILGTVFWNEPLSIIQVGFGLLIILGIFLIR